MQKLKGLKIIGYISLEKGNGKIYQKRSTMRAIDTRTRNKKAKATPHEEMLRRVKSQDILMETVRVLSNLQ